MDTSWIDAVQLGDGTGVGVETPLLLHLLLRIAPIGRRRVIEKKSPWSMAYPVNSRLRHMPWKLRRSTFRTRLRRFGKDWRHCPIYQSQRF